MSTAQSLRMAKCLDYSRSFVLTHGTGNTPRFWIESWCRVIDDKSGRFTDFYQTGSCKGERTYAKKDLFVDPNYDFLSVFSEQSVLVFRRGAAYNGERPSHHDKKKKHPYTTCYADMDSLWGELSYSLSQPDNTEQLDDIPRIIEAADACHPLVAKTEIWNDETQLRAIIEYPIKSINLDRINKQYQIDTGPILLPDLTMRPDQHLASLRLAYVAFNDFHFADFIIESRTSIKPESSDSTYMYHYSEITSMRSKNTLYALA